MVAFLGANGSNEVVARGEARAVTALLGSWRLVGKIGEGAMADVFAAAPADASPDSRPAYAVKVLKERWQREFLARRLFQREAMVGGTVSDPHVIAVLDWQVKQTPCYVVMPLLYGATLRKQLLPERLPALPVALWIARQVAEGLRALDDAGFIHGDVKPSNIFLSPEGHATLLDLGYSQKRGEQTSIGERPVVGTPEYLAPEAFLAASLPDIRSDLYSVGVLLYEMLTGRLPFEGRNPAEVAQMRRQGVPDRLRCLAPQLPREVVELVRGLLAREPLRRPQSPQELIDRLAKLEVLTFHQRFAG